MNGRRDRRHRKATKDRDRDGGILSKLNHKIFLSSILKQIQEEEGDEEEHLPFPINLPTPDRNPLKKKKKKKKVSEAEL